MRIALFVHEFPALNETFVLSQATGLLRLDCDVRIFATRRPEEPVEHADVQRFALAQRTVYLARPTARIWRIAAAFAILSRHLLRRPRHVLRALNPWRYGRLAVSLELLFWLDRLADAENRFDVLLCHYGTIGRTVAVLREIGAIDGVLVTVFHGADVSVSLARHPHLYRHLFQHGDLFLPVSDRWRERLIAQGCDPEATIVHHMGVDLSRFAAGPHHVTGDASLGVLTIGRLVEGKGIEDGLRAAALARDRGVRLRYTIIGGGPLRESLKAQADDLGLAGTVSFVGWQEQDMVLAHIRRNQVLLAPSVTGRQGEEEGIPIALMEAMATGMPVISTYHSSIPELVMDGGSGLLVEEGDIEGLADALVQLHRDPMLRDALGRRARKAVADGFDVRVLNGRLLDILGELTGMYADVDHPGKNSAPSQRAGSTF